LLLKVQTFVTALDKKAGEVKEALVKIVNNLINDGKTAVICLDSVSLIVGMLAFFGGGGRERYKVADGLPPLSSNKPLIRLFNNRKGVRELAVEMVFRRGQTPSLQSVVYLGETNLVSPWHKVAPKKP